MITCNAPLTQYQAIQDELDATLQRVLSSGVYVGGAEVDRFEQEFAAFVGVKHAMGVASGTDAIELALRAVGIGAGDEVITASFGPHAVASAILNVGACPVLVDIDPATFLIDIDLLDRAFTARTKAVLAVHLFGQSIRVNAVADACRKRGVILIEDCAQAHGGRFAGSRLGSFGQVSCFSFYPTKNLGAFGDAGAILTDDSSLAARVIGLREYGWDNGRISRDVSGVSRMDAIQAGVLRVKLKRLDEENLVRQKTADFYDESFASTSLILPKNQYDAHVFHQYVVRSDQRQRLFSSLQQQDIVGGIHYAHPIHTQPAYQGLVRCVGALTHTENAAQEVLSLPIHPGLTEVDRQQIVSSVLRFEQEKLTAVRVGS